MKKIKYISVISAISIILIIIFFNYFVKFLPGPKIIISSGTFLTGDTLSLKLQEEGIPQKDSDGITAAINYQCDLTKIQQGDIYEIHKTTYNKPVKFIYKPNPVDSYHVFPTTYGTKGWSCEKKVLQLEKVLVKTTGQIETTLYEAMIKNNIEPELIMKFADIFSWQIDFFAETQKNDSFKFVYEQFKHKNKVIYSGIILWAEYIFYQNKKKYIAIYFKDPTGYADYYDTEGKSVRKMFLKAPLTFRRIASYFSHKRFHPILRYYRPHHGIDYSAPNGTPVDSIGDGVVTFCGWKGGFGKLIIIRHNSTYSTYYGHLSQFTKGIKVGKRVKQRDMIGRVGSTGLSTGPHLHFGITKNGKFANFLKLQFPSASSINKKYLEEFKKIKEFQSQ